MEIDIKNLTESKIDEIIDDLKKLDFDSRLTELFKIVDLIGYNECNYGKKEFDNIGLIFDSFTEELDTMVKIIALKNKI